MISAFLGTNHSVTKGIIEDQGHRLAGFQRRKIAGVDFISGPVPTYIPHRSLTVRNNIVGLRIYLVRLLYSVTLCSQLNCL